jgi:hypothetical protein
LKNKPKQKDGGRGPSGRALVYKQKALILNPSTAKKKEITYFQSDPADIFVLLL